MQGQTVEQPGLRLFNEAIEIFLRYGQCSQIIRRIAIPWSGTPRRLQYGINISNRACNFEKVIGIV